MLEPKEVAELMLDSIKIEEGEGFKFNIEPDRDSFLKSKTELKHNILENPIRQ